MRLKLFWGLQLGSNGFVWDREVAWSAAGEVGSDPAGEVGVGDDQGLVGDQALASGGLADLIEEEGGDGFASDPRGGGGLEGLIDRGFHDVRGDGDGLGDGVSEDDRPGEVQTPVRMDQAGGGGGGVDAVFDREAAGGGGESGERGGRVADHEDAAGFEGVEGRGDVEDRLDPRADHRHPVGPSQGVEVVGDVECRGCPAVDPAEAAGRHDPDPD